MRILQEISSKAENPRQWLAAYLGARTQLASYQSDFHCDPACTRPGCKNQDLHVPVSIVDLMGAAMHRDEPVSEHYRRHYSMGLLADERNHRFGQVLLKLRKPCPFLENDLCSIYPVRPLPCILFPEYLVHRGTFEAAAAKEMFRDYLCLQRPLHLSPQRAKVIAQLRGMLERESLISSFYLFHHGSCSIDLSGLIEELITPSRSPSEPVSAEGPGRLEPPAHRVVEQFFLECSASCPPFSGVREKIAQLNNRKGQIDFLQLFQDKLLMKKLMQSGDGRALVFHFVKGQLQAKRRGIIPSEYNFYW